MPSNEARPARRAPRPLVAGLVVLALVQGLVLGVACSVLACCLRMPTPAERQWLFLVPGIVMSIHAALVIALGMRSQRIHVNARGTAVCSVLSMATVPPALVLAADARLWLARDLTLVFGHTRGPGTMQSGDPLVALVQSATSTPVEGVIWICRAISAVLEPLLDRLALYTLVGSTCAVVLSLVIWLASRARLRRISG